MMRQVRSWIRKRTPFHWALIAFWAFIASGIFAQIPAPVPWYHASQERSFFYAAEPCGSSSEMDMYGVTDDPSDPATMQDDRAIDARCTVKFVGLWGLMLTFLGVALYAAVMFIRTMPSRDHGDESRQP